ncbi:MAG: DivIVA domain-containing protein [Acidimicrobiales bacterium]|jgi:cell division septum initiation protein DivIVA
MSEDPQVVSLSSGAPLSPDEVAHKSFPTARRGVDGEAVRVFLGKVAAELRGALEREAILRERVAEAERRAEDPVLDEATLTRAIGIETAKILWTAHDAAAKVVAKAEERAAELIAEAGQVLAEQEAASEAEALEIRARAEREAEEYMNRARAEADSMTEVAHAEAVELFDATKEECRRMVAEARGLRNRALADLVARRRDLRVQLEELRTGKDSLLSVVDAVGASVDELRGRLAAAEDEARVAAEQAGERVAQELGRGDLVELEAELAAAAQASNEFGGDEEALSAVASASGGDGAGGPGTVARPAGEGSGASRQSVDELFARIRASRAAEEAAAQATTAVPVVAEAEQSAEPAAEAPEAHEEQQPVGQGSSETIEVAQGAEASAGSPALIAERAESVAAAVEELAEVVVARSDADAITEPDVESLARRDHLLGSITAKLGRALKRALQDDQNDLLNALRQSSRKPVLDELMPPNVQRERFVAAASDPLAKAYEAGAAFLVAGDAVAGPCVTAPAPSAAVAFEAGALIAAELADDLSTVLRQRIEESLSELEGSLEGSADAAGVAYREWKGTRVEGLAGDFTTRAFATGELAVLSSLGNGEAPLLRWAVEDDDGGGSCPDCDDNSLAGPQPPGAAFPTGHAHPPVHPGCRCLLVPVRS